ncbi:MAG: hypothetical protein JEZ08_04535 [Clostridiales bacterium]|nr:hypothetical protein [Clostridiales bacterium]
MKKITTFVFLIFICSILFLNIIIADSEISFSERRTLKEFPELNFDTIMSGEFMTELEPYLLDQMVLRDNFRQLKSWFELSVLSKKDVNDLFVKEDHIFKLEYPYKPELAKHFVAYINKINDLYLKDNQVYISLIPDKNYFLDDNYLKIDYDDMIAEIKSSDLEYIDIFQTLSLGDYYKTDPHWRQENLSEVIEILSKEMNFELKYQMHDYIKSSFNNFYGAYASQSGFRVDSDELVYLSHPDFEDLIIKNYEKSDATDLYDVTSLEGMDAYDVFLSGASPLIEIYNPNADTTKELLIFRDSFGSSITPLLVGSYEKITLVDTRYVAAEYLDQFINFADQDVLFLYSTLVVNNSIMLK